jgi:hypothetical protein
MPTAVPSLDELARDPERATDLPIEVVSALLSRCAAVQLALAAKIGRTQVAEPRAESIDRTLDANQIAAALGVPRRWVFRNVATLPFVRRVSLKKLACSEADLRRWRAARKA